MQIRQKMIAEFHHPVLPEDALDYLNPKRGDFIVDCTLGAGGHASLVLEKSSPDGVLLGLDIDPEAIRIAEERLAVFGDRLITRNCRYTELLQVMNELNWDDVDGILIDLGVSSMQLDDPGRGFSFKEEGPLDMRMNPESGRSAADLINHLTKEEIREILSDFGEERFSNQIAAAIVDQRPLSTTKQLAEIASGIYQKKLGSTKKHKIHPATRTFQAFRIAVNQELAGLESILSDAVTALKSGGRLVVISFHSLEDRIVKQFFNRERKFCICPPEQLICTCDHIPQLNVLTRKPVFPGQEEILRNKRARSSRLRAAEKL